MYRSKCVSEQSFRLQDEEQTAPYEARVADRRPIRKCLLWSRYAMTEKL